MENSNEKNPATEYLGNTIIDVFDNYSGKLLKSKMSFCEGFYKENMPSILTEPRDINTIEVN